MKMNRNFVVCGDCQKEWEIPVFAFPLIAERPCDICGALTDTYISEGYARKVVVLKSPRKWKEIEERRNSE